MAAFPSNADRCSICCVTGSILARSNTRVKSCPASSQRSWIGNFLMQFSRSSPINGPIEITPKPKPIVVYKVDRLTRSLADFAKLVELFDAQGVSFVSVTQQFNTTTSMGRLTLNVLLSFAQFEREVTSERIRDKIAASKRNAAPACG